jgi:hypothetical protein
MSFYTLTCTNNADIEILKERTLKRQTVPIKTVGILLSRLLPMSTDWPVRGQPFCRLTPQMVASHILYDGYKDSIVKWMAETLLEEAERLGFTNPLYMYCNSCSSAVCGNDPCCESAAQWFKHRKGDTCQRPPSKATYNTSLKWPSASKRCVHSEPPTSRPSSPPALSAGSSASSGSEWSGIVTAFASYAAAQSSSNTGRTDILE